MEAKEIQTPFIDYDFPYFKAAIESNDRDAFLPKAGGEESAKAYFESVKKGLIETRIDKMLGLTDEKSTYHQELLYVRGYMVKVFDLVEKGEDLRIAFENPEVMFKFIHLSGKYLIREDWTAVMFYIRDKVPSKSYLDSVASQERKGKELKDERERQEEEGRREAEERINVLNQDELDSLFE